MNTDESIRILIDKLKSKDVFTYVRFGDGDFIMMYKDSINNVVGRSNQFKVTKSLHDEMIESYNISDEKYIIGSIMTDGSKHSTAKNIDISRLGHIDIKKDSISCICIQETFLYDVNLFYKFIRELKKTNTMLVCGYYDKILDDFYGDIKYHVTTPRLNSYSDIDNIMNRILDNIHKVDKIILSTGQTSRVVSKRLYKMGVNKTIIDVGSLSDMLIIDSPIFNNIRIRSHITNNMDRIKTNIYKLYKLMINDE